jgi:hypothetical protein
MLRFLSSSLFHRRIPLIDNRFGVTAGSVLFLALAWMLAASWPAMAATATTTTLAVTSGGSAVTTVASGTVVTLTATVAAGTAPVTLGQVNFCDATAAHCEDIHIVGTAQLTGAGIAVFKFRPGVGSHSYKAVFAGTNSYSGSASVAAPLTVSGPAKSFTTMTATAGTDSNNYNLSASVIGGGSTSPTGTVSFVDTSNSNAIVGTETLGSGSSALGFLNSADPGTGYYPIAIVVTDFNGDGIPDLAIANYQSNTVTVLLGKGDGTFTAAPTLTTGSDPYALAVADFNGDGIPDLAVVNDIGGYGSTSNVTVFLGKGDGTFTTVASNPSVGSGGESIVAGDFNGDGIQDLAVANFYSNSVTILLGNGDGTFTSAPISPPVRNAPHGMVAADFNGDGKLDLALMDFNRDTVTVLLGNGDGTFTPAAGNAATGVYPQSIAVTDFNGDGVPDLAIGSMDHNVTILLGTGTGTFTAAPSPGGVVYVAIGDFNGDGIPDLAGTSGFETVVFLGNGDGTFSTGPTYNSSHVSAEIDFVCLATGDFNGDGVSDLAEAGLIPPGWAQRAVADPAYSVAEINHSGDPCLSIAGCNACARGELRWRYQL